MLINDVGYFYRPRFAAPPMTEEEYMGPYYGMNDDELQSYSTQIVPPQDLFGLGQGAPAATKSYFNIGVEEAPTSNMSLLTAHTPLSIFPGAKVEIWKAIDPLVGAVHDSKTTSTSSAVSFELPFPPGTEIGYRVSRDGYESAQGATTTTALDGAIMTIALSKKESPLPMILVAGGLGAGVGLLIMYFIKGR